MVKSIWVAITGVIALIYIINPTAGVLEIIPDNLPIIGNLDEATAVVVLLSCLRYFGFDFSRIFGGRKKRLKDDHYSG